MSEHSQRDYQVLIYAQGMVSLSCCAPKGMTIDEVAQSVNTQQPTGISSAWTLANEPFADGNQNPCQCEESESRQHFLFHC